MRVCRHVAKARPGLAKIIVSVVDEELLARGDLTVGDECNAPAATVRDCHNVQVWLTAVIDEPSDLCEKVD